MNSPMQLHIPAHAPRAGGSLWRATGRVFLRLFGWRVTGAFPEDPKVLAIAAPHTSNWDWLIGVFALMATGLRLTYIAKHSAFVGPVGWLMRATGGVPVDRSQASSTVDEIVQQFEQNDSLYYVIAPEGTRKHVERWKTGFLRVAYQAGVAVVMVSFDYPTRTIRVGEKAPLTGDIDKDLQAVQDYYRQFRGRNSA